MERGGLVCLESADPFLSCIRYRVLVSIRAGPSFAIYPKEKRKRKAPRRIWAFDSLLPEFSYNNGAIIPTCFSCSRVFFGVLRIGLFSFQETAAHKFCVCACKEILNVVVDGLGVFGTGRTEKENGVASGVDAANMPVDKVKECERCFVCRVFHRESVGAFMSPVL